MLAADPRTARAATGDPALCGEKEQNACGDALRAPPFLVLRVSNLLTQLRNVPRQLATVCLAMSREGGECSLLHLSQPCVAITGDAGLLEQLDELHPLPDDERLRASGLNDGHQLDRNDEHRPAHAEHLQEGPLLVQRALDGPDLRALHARPGGQEH